MYETVLVLDIHAHIGAGNVCLYTTKLLFLPVSTAVRLMLRWHSPRSSGGRPSCWSGGMQHSTSMYVYHIANRVLSLLYRGLSVLTLYTTCDTLGVIHLSSPHPLHRYANLFLHPVREDDAPGYRDVALRCVHYRILQCDTCWTYTKYPERKQTEKTDGIAWIKPASTKPACF